ncbi:unnamed protein product [Phyllotreta striolata]|uniref:C3H1-type domain-containing protein n=1 Tax=Phyllotreta striolata TaxID=444603 RepID=A0A9N9U0V3_PHYSR|nr:unnamed protein product [Phyllotreta striolata]
MPVEVYNCRDNFFKRMTDLDSPKKNNDCYFYYYSTCAKGESCAFRHEPSALGCETTCSFWKEGKCVNVRCNFRHMELRKNRKAIPCYWESQPKGCLKAHCPFMHTRRTGGDAANDADDGNVDGSKGAVDDDRKVDLSASNERKVTIIDSLVANFQEEASIPNQRLVRVKSLDEIRQENSLMDGNRCSPYNNLSSIDTQQADAIRRRIYSRMIHKNNSDQIRTTDLRKRLSDSQFVSTEEKKRKISIKSRLDGKTQATPTRLNSSLNDAKPHVSVTVSSTGDRSCDTNRIKIKTLDEIKAERRAKNAETETKRVVEEEETVTSTSMDLEVDDFRPLESKSHTKKIILKRENPATKTESPIEMDTESELSKLDERLLLSDDEFDCDEVVLLKPEEELLNEIDEYLLNK